MAALPKNTINISRPVPNTQTEIQVPPKAYLNFNFSLEGADMSKAGDDLRIVMPDGAVVLCLGYFRNSVGDDAPQIAVNGIALPLNGLDVTNTDNYIEGQLPEGDNNGENKEGEALSGQDSGQADTAQGPANAVTPASSTAPVTGQAGGEGSPASASPSSSASSSSASSGASSGLGVLPEGAFKLDMNVDFLGGINRLPGLDISSDRGFNNTWIEGGALPEQNRPAPETPTEPSIPVLQSEARGLREGGFDIQGSPVNDVDSTSHIITAAVPAGTDPESLSLVINPGNDQQVLQPGETYSTPYGDISYTITVNTDNTCTITLTYSNLDINHADVNGLKLGEYLRDSCRFDLVQDGNGGSTVLGSHLVNFVIEGSNDAPTLKPDFFSSATGTDAVHAEVKEEGVYGGNKNTEAASWDQYAPGTPDTDSAFGTHKSSVTVWLQASDPDNGDALTFQLDGVNLAAGGSLAGIAALNPVAGQSGTYTLTLDGDNCGTVTLDAATGQLTFTLNSASPHIEGMRAEQFANFTFNITVSDANGLKSSGDFTLTVHGTNDRPTLDFVEPKPDSGIVIDPNGNAQARIEGTGEHNSYNTVEGSLAGSDKDSGDTLTYHILNDPQDVGQSLAPSDYGQTLDGTYGTLTLDPATGTFTYTENGTLDHNETVSESFTVLVKDANGAFSTREITFEVHGGNKAPTFQGFFSDPAGASQVTSGQVKEEGVFNGNTSTSDGNWSDYAPGTLPDAADYGTHKGEVTLYLKATDGDTAEIPKLRFRLDSVTLKEGSLHEGKDVALIAVPGQTGTWTLTIDSQTCGTLTLDAASGKLTFSLDNNSPLVRAMQAGDANTFTLTASVIDPGGKSDSGSFELVVHGTNDRPALSLDTSASDSNFSLDTNGNATIHISEGEILRTTVQGTLAGTDTDRNTTLTYKIYDGIPDDSPLGSSQLSGSLEGQYGTLTLDPATGVFTYTENGKQKAGHTDSDTFQVVVIDEHGAYSTKQLTFTVKGENTPPTFDGISSIVGGTLNAHAEVKEEGLHNGNKPTTEGTWDHYEPGTPSSNAAFGTHKGEVTVFLRGSDLDEDTSEANLKFSLGEVSLKSGSVGDGTGTATATLSKLSSSDDLTTYILKINGISCGTLTLNAVTGELTFNLDQRSSVVQSMGAGETNIFIFDAIVTDPDLKTGSGKFELAIHGTNDKPDLSIISNPQVQVGQDGNAIASFMESGDNTTHASVSGFLAGHDDDVSDNMTFHIAKDADVANKPTLGSGDALSTLDGTYGTLTVDAASGEFTYTENGTLRAGQAGRDTFTVLVKDAHGAFTTKELTFEVTGKDNTISFTPSTGDNFVAELVESGVLPGGNTPNTDSSASEGMKEKLTVTGDIRKLATGGDFIVDDDTYDETHPSTTTFIIKAKGAGTGDAALGSTDSNGIQTIPAACGSFTFNTKTGEYTYTLKDEADINALNKDESIVERFSVWVTKNGETVHEDFAINIRGMNDKPTITRIETAFTITEDSLDKPGSTLEGHDVDNADELSYGIASGSSMVQVQSGKYGILYMDADGNYHYELDNSRDVTQALGRGQTGEDKFTLRVTDKAGAYDEKEITVTITGTFDEPKISYKTGEVIEDGGSDPAIPSSTSGSIAIDVVDDVHQNNRAYAVLVEGGMQSSMEGTTQVIITAHGVLRFDTLTGNYTYIVNDSTNTSSAVQKLNVGDSLRLDSFHVRVTFGDDTAGSGNAYTQDTSLDIDIKGINDAPTLVGSTSDYEKEITRTHPMDITPEVEGQAHAEDVDNNYYGSTSTEPSQLIFCFKVTINGKTEYVQNIETAYGHVSIDAVTGAYKYTLNNLDPAVRGLQANDPPLSDTFKVVVYDPHGAEDSRDVTITIKGTDDGGPGQGNHDLPNVELVVQEDSSHNTTQRPNPGETQPGLEDGTTGGQHNPDGQPIRYCFVVDGKASQSMQGAYGDIYIDAYTGAYRYVLNNQHTMVQALAAGQIEWEYFNVHSFTMNGNDIQLGEEKGTITVKVEGANDAPELFHDTHASDLTIFAGATGLTTSGKFSATDVDVTDRPGLRFNFSDVYAGETELVTRDIFASGDPTLKLGTITLNTITGDYTFTLLHSISGSQSITFTVWVHDNHEGGLASEDVTINLTAANARPVIVSCTASAGFFGDASDYAYGENPDLGVNSANGEITLDGQSLPSSDLMELGILETTTTLKGSFSSWDYEVAQGQTPKYSYFLCDENGNIFGNMDINNYGTLQMNMDGTFTFTLNINTNEVRSLGEDMRYSLNYHVLVKDAAGSSSAVQDFNITITGTNNQPDITVTNGSITMNKNDSDTPQYVLNLVDPDLNPDAGHGFIFKMAGEDKNGSFTDESGLLNADINKIYTFETAYGSFKVQADTNDATKFKYWFELNQDAVADLNATDNISLKFQLAFDDGQRENSQSNFADVTINIKGTSSISTTMLHLDTVSLLSDAVPDATFLAGHQDTRPAADFTAMNLETPLAHLPMPDMASSVGHESLQFQLQTTGV